MYRNIAAKTFYVPIQFLRVQVFGYWEKFTENENGQSKYLLSGEMAQSTVSLELPPSDSRIKCVKQEPLYITSSCLPDRESFARVFTKCLQ